MVTPLQARSRKNIAMKEYRQQVMRLLGQIGPPAIFTSLRSYSYASMSTTSNSVDHKKTSPRFGVYSDREQEIAYHQYCSRTRILLGTMKTLVKGMERTLTLV
eukprot:3207160-Karenia_brevis.AAC.1